MGFATINDALFIQGGFDVAASSQFVSLDLSTSWSSTSPAWKNRKDGQSTSHLALAPISAASNGGSQGSLLAIGGMGNVAFFNSYDIASDTWSTLSSVKPPYPTMEGHAAVSDPNTGLVYMVGGYGNNTFNSLSVYDPKSKSMVSQQSASAANSLTDVGAVWVNGRNSVVTFGGSRAPPAGTSGLGGGDLNEYDTASKSWKIMSTSGDVPPARLDHCMAASEDGSKIVLFGGTLDGNVYYNTIYILDVSSGKWKQGTSAPVARTRMACAFHSYQFIAWGGSTGSNRNTMLNNLPIIYNLNSDEWTDSYNANEKVKKSNIGAVVGGVIAFLVIVGTAAFLVVRRRRKRREEDDAAYRADALAAAAISAEDEDHNVKVLAMDDYGQGAGYGQEYQLHKMDMSDSRYNGVGSVEGYHDGLSGTTVISGSGGSADGSDHYHYHSTSMSPSGQGSEKLSSPYAPHSAVAASPFAMSPAQMYSGAMLPGSAAGTPYLQSPPVAYLHHSNDSNPFVSPEDYHHPPMPVPQPGYLYQGTPTSSTNSSPNPFTTNTTAVATTNVGPFQQQTYHQSPGWPPVLQGQQSPSPGARAPQVILDSGSNTSDSGSGNVAPANGYVPPPPPM
ncbi:hypothetical protein EDD11_008478 [Mortierella claussenii]|nr:hypothetical protein EDD11_008478 [Mortierella claussenii]